MQSPLWWISSLFIVNVLLYRRDEGRGLLVRQHIAAREHWIDSLGKEDEWATRQSFRWCCRLTVKMIINYGKLAQILKYDTLLCCDLSCEKKKSPLNNHLEDYLFKIVVKHQEKRNNFCAIIFHDWIQLIGKSYSLWLSGLCRLILTHISGSIQPVILHIFPQRIDELVGESRFTSILNRADLLIIYNDFTIIGEKDKTWMEKEPQSIYLSAQ